MSNETNETPIQGRKVGIARFFELLGRDLWPLYKSGILCVLGFLPGTALAVFGMMACGLPDGQYSLGGQAVTVRGPRATLTEQPGTIAGSATCLFDCMKRAVLDMGVPLESAVRAATLNPARSIGIDADYGSLDAGRYGNVVLVDDKLDILKVVRHGEVIG